MVLYFRTKRAEYISVEEIIIALKNLKPSITLFTVCKESSSRISSFNNTLSKVKLPIQTDIGLNVLSSQPSIAASLQQSVNEAALQAAEDAGLIPHSITPDPGSTISSG